MNETNPVETSICRWMLTAELITIMAEAFGKDRPHQADICNRAAKAIKLASSMATGEYMMAKGMTTENSDKEAFLRELQKIVDAGWPLLLAEIAEHKPAVNDHSNN